LGYAANTAIGQDGNTGATVAWHGTKWNDLTKMQTIEYLKLIKDTRNNVEKQNRIIQEAKLLSDSQPTNNRNGVYVSNISSDGSITMNEEDNDTIRVTYVYLKDHDFNWPNSLVDNLTAGKINSVPEKLVKYLSDGIAQLTGNYVIPNFDTPLNDLGESIPLVNQNRNNTATQTADEAIETMSQTASDVVDTVSQTASNIADMVSQPDSNVVNTVSQAVSGSDDFSYGKSVAINSAVTTTALPATVAKEVAHINVKGLGHVGDVIGVVVAINQDVHDYSGTDLAKAIGADVTGGIIGGSTASFITAAGTAAGSIAGPAGAAAGTVAGAMIGGTVGGTFGDKFADAIKVNSRAKKDKDKEKGIKNGQ
jgi:hypothetical protein